MTTEPAGKTDKNWTDKTDKAPVEVSLSDVRKMLGLTFSDILDSQTIARSTNPDQVKINNLYLKVLEQENAIASTAFARKHGLKLRTVDKLGSSVGRLMEEIIGEHPEVFHIKPTEDLMIRAQMINSNIENYVAGRGVGVTD